MRIAATRSTTRTKVDKKRHDLARMKMRKIGRQRAPKMSRERRLPNWSVQNRVMRSSKPRAQKRRLSTRKSDSRKPRIARPAGAPLVFGWSECAMWWRLELRARARARAHAASRSQPAKTPQISRPPIVRGRIATVAAAAAQATPRVGLRCNEAAAASGGERRLKA